MPSGAAVIRYEGARGVSWRIKYADADGRQVMETLGREPEWDRRKAERALGARLADVEKGMRKPRRRTFDDLADEFERWRCPRGRGRRPRSSRLQADAPRTICARGSRHIDLARLSQSPEEFERYAVAKMRDGLSPKTVRNHLVLLGLMFRTARRWRWVSENPLDLVEKPAAGRAETETIDAATIADLIAAYRVLEADCEDDERFWFEARPQDDGRGALYGPQARRTARAAVEGRRPPGTASERPQQFVRQRDHDAEVQGGATDDPARPGRGRRRSRSSTGRRVTGPTSRSCSRIRRSGHRSTRRSSPGTRGRR